MTRKEVVKQKCEQAEVELKDLRKSVRKLMKDFGGCEVATRAEINEADDVYEGKLLGTRVTEHLCITEKYNGLFGIDIIRTTYIDEDDPEDYSCDDYIKIDLYWNDYSDHLTYTEDYYPNKSNESIIEQVKALITAANLIMEKAWTKR